MRYHYAKPEQYHAYYGHTYICDHPVYNRCTLYVIGKRGLAVIQQRSSEARDGLYPTVSVRQLMWGLKMKPLKRERWETCFDRRLV